MGEVYSAETSEVALEAIINNAVQIPGVKVDRQKFLGECFAKEDVDTQQIIDLGPIGAGCTREDLAQIANKLILVRTSTSSAASFAMGIPGGLAMGLTVPADTLQFFGMSLRLAQELAYLYGAQDLWKDGQIDDEIVRGQLILYCGVMFGVLVQRLALEFCRHNWRKRRSKTAAKGAHQNALVSDRQAGWKVGRR